LSNRYFTDFHVFLSPIVAGREVIADPIGACTVEVGIARFDFKTVELEPVCDMNAR